jgi:hypothetical protein
MENLSNGSPAQPTRVNTMDSLTDEQKLQLVQRYTSGELVKTLLSDYSLNRKDFAEFRKQHNLNLRLKEPTIKTPEQIKQLLADYYSGAYKVNEITSKWRISTATLYHYVKAHSAVGDASNGLNNPHLSNFKKKKNSKKTKKKEQ